MQDIKVNNASIFFFGREREGGRRTHQRAQRCSDSSAACYCLTTPVCFFKTVTMDQSQLANLSPQQREEIMQTVQAQVALANMQVQHTGGPGQHAGTAHRWPWPTCRYSTCGMGQQHVGTVRCSWPTCRYSTQGAWPIRRYSTGGIGQQHVGTVQVFMANMYSRCSAGGRRQQTGSILVALTNMLVI